MEMRIGGPSEDKETDGDEPARTHHWDESHFGGGMSIVFSYLAHVIAVDDGSAQRRCDDPESERDEHESSGAGGVAFSFLVDDGEGDKEHVEETVENAHVEGNEEDDEFSEEQLEGTDEEDTETFCEGTEIEILFCDVFRLAGLLAHFLGPSREDGRRVGFGDREGDEDPDDKGEDDLDVVEPAPACCVGEEATDQRTDCGTDERRGREGGHRDTAFFGAPEIGEGTAYEGHGG